MKFINKTYFLPFFIFFINIVFSQNKYSDARLINLNNDTINCKIKIYYNFLNKNYLNDADYFGGVTIVDENGNSVEKISSLFIKELKFVDIFDIERVYLNNGVFFKQLLFNGSKIKWFRTMTMDLFNGPSFKDYLIDDKGKITNVELLRIKKRLKEATLSKPELAPEIEGLSVFKFGDADMFKILKKFEE